MELTKTMCGGCQLTLNLREREENEWGRENEVENSRSNRVSPQTNGRAEVAEVAEATVEGGRVVAQCGCGAKKRSKEENPLTAGEMDIAERIGNGEYTEHIAQARSTSYRTVVNQTQSIYDKLEINRCLHAIAAWWHTEGRHYLGSVVVVFLLSLGGARADEQARVQRRRQHRAVQTSTRRGRGRSRREEMEFPIEYSSRGVVGTV